MTEVHEKFTEFYRKYEDLMYQIADGLLKDSYAAEDAVQIAFMNIYKNFQGIEDIESRRTKHFVVTVTKRVAIDILRMKQRRKVEEFSYEELRKASNDQQEKNIIESNEVMACVRRMPKKYADVLLLKYIHGYKVTEIAGIIGSAQGTVCSLLFRGKKLFLEELVKSGIDICA